MRSAMNGRVKNVNSNSFTLDSDQVTRTALGIRNHSANVLGFSLIVLAARYRENSEETDRRCNQEI